MGNENSIWFSCLKFFTRMKSYFLRIIWRLALYPFTSLICFFFCKIFSVKKSLLSESYNVLTKCNDKIFKHKRSKERWVLSRFSLKNNNFFQIDTFFFILFLFNLILFYPIRFDSRALLTNGNKRQWSRKHWFPKGIVKIILMLMVTHVRMHVGTRLPVYYRFSQAHATSLDDV